MALQRKKYKRERIKVFTAIEKKITRVYTTYACESLSSLGFLPVSRLIVRRKLGKSRCKNAHQLTYTGLIQITADVNNRIDGVSETDGLEATNANLGGVFSEGLWVVQDGRNVMPLETQNFKLVSGATLKEAIRHLANNTHELNN